MAKFPDALKDILLKVAPTVATVLGGPLSGAAVTVLTNKFRNPGEEGPEPTLEDITPEILRASPETLLKLREAELEMQKVLTDADIKLAELDVQDRTSARQRQIELKDWTPSVLAASLTAGFFGVMLWMLAYGLPTNGESALLIMIGALGAGFTQVLNYFFGSSSGSKNKQATIDDAMAKK